MTPARTRFTESTVRRNAALSNDEIKKELESPKNKAVLSESAESSEYKFSFIDPGSNKLRHIEIKNTNPTNPFIPEFSYSEAHEEAIYETPGELWSTQTFSSLEAVALHLEIENKLQPKPAGSTRRPHGSVLSARRHWHAIHARGNNSGASPRPSTETSGGGGAKAVSNGKKYQVPTMMNEGNIYVEPRDRYTTEDEAHGALSLLPEKAVVVRASTKTNALVLCAKNSSGDIQETGVIGDSGSPVKYTFEKMQARAENRPQSLAELARAFQRQLK